jgi:hypothetical protein
MVNEMAWCRFLFWNVNNKDLTAEVCALASDTKADAVFLCENGNAQEAAANASSLLQSLKANVSQNFSIPNATPASDARFLCFCRNKRLGLEEVSSETRVSVREWRLGKYSILLALIHGLDKRNNGLSIQQSSARDMADRIREIASDRGIDRVLWLGDFNLNPFDAPMSVPDCFNAMMTRECVARRHCTYLSCEYDLYYNPMWGHLGDRTEGPSGTYYYTGRGQYGWNMIDQVLIHFSLVPFYRDVQILTMAGQAPLVDKNGRPNDRNTPSDHLPILVSFEGDDNG